MNRQRKCGILMVAGALMAFVLPLAFAGQHQQEPAQSAATGEKEHAEAALQQMPATRMQVVRAEELIGTDVKNHHEEKIGTIREVVLTRERDKVSYVALGYGGTLGVNEKLVAIPWSAANVKKVEEGIRVTMNITRSELDQAAGFSEDNWPARGERQFEGRREHGVDVGTGTDIYGTPVQERKDKQEYKRDKDKSRDYEKDRERKHMEKEEDVYGAPDRAQSQESMRHCRVRELVGMNVVNMHSEDIADIDDIAFCSSTGQVIYGIVSFGGMWGIGQNLAAVPWDALTIQPDQNIAMLDTDMQTLEALAFQRGEYPDLSDPGYARNVYQRFGQEPDEAIFGAPAEEGQRLYQQEQMQQTADMGEHQAWLSGSDYNENFDPQSMETITGTIASVGTFRPQRLASPGQRLRVRTPEGRTVTVHLGPRHYLQQHGLRLNQGDQVTITGSMTRVGWRNVLMASEIQVRDRNVQLRDKQGQPRWSEQDLMMMQQHQ